MGFLNSVPGIGLNCLAEIDARKMKVIELRFFGGLSAKETAEVLKNFATDGNARLQVGEGLDSTRTETETLSRGAR
jgi:hypothetical protein